MLIDLAVISDLQDEEYYYCVFYSSKLNFIVAKVGHQSLHLDTL